MRNWGIVVTAFYAVIVLLLFSFGLLLLAEDWNFAARRFDGWIVDMWILVLIPVSGQVLLMILSVDTTWRRLKPQRHAKVTAGLVGFMVMLLTLAVIFSITAAIYGDNVDPFVAMSEASVTTIVIGTILGIWLIWGVVFYTFSKRASNIVESAVTWLIRGSVLELLVAVPCHIIVRQREWCCAQYVSAAGIATGIAIMLLAFGPSALFLYKRKLADYKDGSPVVSEEVTE